MLGNCEKMMVVSSSSTTSHQWPPQPQNQNHQIDDQKGLLINMDSSASRVLMEKPNQEQQQQQQQQAPLKCPRCDSSNTKFCYYNNYSLSQPRHFCKACKRYWTRGGTLRNVPVGGGCRKNKRIKRPSSSSGNDHHQATSSSSAQTAAASSNPSTTTTTSTTPGHQLDLSSSASHINPLFYSLLTGNANHDLSNLAYPRFSTYDDHLHQPQMSDLELRFSSELLAPADFRNIHHGFNSTTTKQIQDVINPSNIYNPIFGSSSSSVSSSSTSTIGSLLLASTLQRQKFGVANGFHGGFEPYEEIQQMGKDVKMEEGQNRMEWGGHSHNTEQINSSDQSLFWNNTTGIGAWLDPSNMGSSVPSLI